MSDDFSESMVISLKISHELYEKLKLQLKLLKEHNIQGLEGAESVEDLVLFYLEHFSAGEEKMKKIEDRMQSVLDTLKDKGVDVMELFDSFSQKMREEEQAEEAEVKEKKVNPTKKKS